MIDKGEMMLTNFDAFGDCAFGDCLPCPSAENVGSHSLQCQENRTNTIEHREDDKPRKHGRHWDKYLRPPFFDLWAAATVEASLGTVSFVVRPRREFERAHLETGLGTLSVGNKIGRQKR